MKEAWVCSVCVQRIDDPYYRDQRRVEYRRDVDDARDKTVTCGRICKTCAHAEAEDLRVGRKRVVIEVVESSEQGAML